jgi:hypothetical protein
MGITFFKIPSYKVDEAPAEGHYEANSALEDEMRGVLSNFDSETPKTVPIPFMEGSTLTGHRKGNGIFLSGRLDIPNCEDVSSHVHTFLALDGDAVKVTCELAIEVAKEYQWEDHGIHLAWAEVMSHIPKAPDAPCTIIVMNPLGLERLVAEMDGDLHQLELLTGFLQTLIGQALLDASVTPSEYMESRPGEENFSPENFIVGVQTGGEIPGKLIVLPGEEGHPQVRAHVLDVDQDVFTITFHSDRTMQVDTEDLGCLTLERGDLLQVLELEEKAAEIWDEVESLSAELQHYLENLETPDPLQHLYTQDHTVDVPEDIARELSALLGVPNRTGG